MGPEDVDVGADVGPAQFAGRVEADGHELTGGGRGAPIRGGWFGPPPSGGPDPLLEKTASPGEWVRIDQGGGLPGGSVAEGPELPQFTPEYRRAQRGKRRPVPFHRLHRVVDGAGRARDVAGWALSGRREGAPRRDGPD